MNVAHTFTHISLCAGIGGLDLGIKRVLPGLRTIAYVEREISACEIMGAQMEKGNLDLAPIWTDIKTFPADQFCGMVDVISGGYPCQPFSVAGKRKGTEDPRHLWPYIRDIVGLVRPGICVFENVRGHVRLGLSEVLGDLRSLGYRVRAGIFSAAEVGAPHRRERVFILATLANAKSGQRGSRGSREKAGKSNVVNCSDSTTLADSIKQGLQRYARNEDRGNEPGRQPENAHGSTSARGVSMAHTDDNRWEGRGLSNGQREEIPETQRRSEILENSIGERRPGRGDKASAGRNTGRPGENAQLQTEGPCTGRWPARPGQPQFQWEKPRVINGKLNSAWVAQLMGFHSDWCEIDGLTREMKLRALGNAVVPHQAAFAIQNLMELF